MKKIISCLLVVAILCSCFVGLQLSASAADLPSSGTCGENVTYTLNPSTGLLTINGVGKIDNFYQSNGLDNNHLVQYSNSPFNNNKEIKDVIITGDVQNIGAALFWNCSNIKSISINTTSIQSIDAFAFSGCSNLTRVDFTDTLKRIDCYAFEKCEKLTNIVIPNSVEELGSYCFDNCSRLKTITVPNNIKFIKSYFKEFDNEYVNPFNTAIERLIITDISNEINKNLVSLFPSLKEFEVPNSVSYIGDGTFKDLNNLTTVTIPKSVTRIEFNAFSGCTNLTIRGYKDSYAETFCKWAGIPFEVIEEPHTHSYTAVVTPPTCTEQGFTTHTCTCGDSYVDTYTQATGHSWSGWQVEIAANCTENGVEIRQCSNDNSHTERRNIAAFGHDYVPEVIQPKATSLGYTRYSCSRCDDTYIKDFKAPTGKLGGFKCKARTSVAQTVTWNKVNSATGYQVQISTKDGKKWSTYANLGSAVNSYTFKKLSAGNNYKFRVRFYIKAPDGKNYFSPWSATLNSPTLPTCTTLTKLSPSSKAFTAQWKVNKTVTGYQIQYSTNSKFTGAKTVTVKSNKTLKTTVKKLSAKKVYYVRIRTYKTISKVNYFSTWSNAVKVKTK